MSRLGLWLRLCLIGSAAGASLLVDVPAPGGRTLHVAAALPLGAITGASLFVALAAWQAKETAGRPTRIQVGFLVLWATVEEAVWRRLLVGALAGAAGLGTAALASTVAFAATHRRGRLAHLVTGGTFCGIYVATGRLAAAVAAHVAYNLLVAVGPRPGPQLRPEPG